MEEMPLSKEIQRIIMMRVPLIRTLLMKQLTKSRHFLGTDYHCWPHDTYEKN